MKRCLVWLTVLSWLAGTFLSSARAAKPSGEGSAKSYEVPAFLAELRRISGILGKKPQAPEVAELRDSLPQSWTVTTSERSYSISTQTLRNFLTGLELKKARAWVELLVEETKNSTSAQSAAPPNARTELNQILSRREFGAVRPPSAWELLRERIALWFGRLLERLFSGVNRYPVGGKVLFWVIVVGGVLWIAVWVLRSWSGRDRLRSLEAGEPVHPVRTWQEWIREAREAAARGDFRQAVHAAYWAGIVRLQDVGIVPKDRTKTPREYLRLATSAAPGEMAAGSSVSEPLSVLTSRLERTWYANRGANLEDFQDSLRQLEALGCPLE